jgi:hypothetical protein
VQYGVGKGTKNCFKFCSKVGKTAAEAHNMFREAYAHFVWNQTTKVLKMEELQGMTMSDLADLQLQVPNV